MLGKVGGNGGVVLGKKNCWERSRRGHLHTLVGVFCS